MLKNYVEIPVRFNEVDSLRVVWHGHYIKYFEYDLNELKEFFNYNEADGDNGIFFIPFEYFIEEFRVVIICYLDKKR